MGLHRDYREVKHHIKCLPLTQGSRTTPHARVLQVPHRLAKRVREGDQIHDRRGVEHCSYVVAQHSDYVWFRANQLVHLAPHQAVYMLYRPASLIGRDQFKISERFQAPDVVAHDRHLCIELDREFPRSSQLVTRHIPEDRPPNRMLQGLVCPRATHGAYRARDGNSSLRVARLAVPTERASTAPECHGPSWSSVSRHDAVGGRGHAFPLLLRSSGGAVLHAKCAPRLPDLDAPEQLVALLVRTGKAGERPREGLNSRGGGLATGHRLIERCSLDGGTRHRDLAKGPICGSSRPTDECCELRKGGCLLRLALRAPAVRTNARRGHVFSPERTAADDARRTETNCTKRASSRASSSISSVTPLAATISPLSGAGSDRTSCRSSPRVSRGAPGSPETSASARASRPSARGSSRRASRSWSGSAIPAASQPLAAALKASACEAIESGLAPRPAAASARETISSAHSSSASTASTAARSRSPDAAIVAPSATTTASYSCSSGERDASTSRACNAAALKRTRARPRTPSASAWVMSYLPCEPSDLAPARCAVELVSSSITTHHRAPNASSSCDHQAALPIATARADPEAGGGRSRLRRPHARRYERVFLPRLLT